MQRSLACCSQSQCSDVLTVMPASTRYPSHVLRLPDRTHAEGREQQTRWDVSRCYLQGLCPWSCTHAPQIPLRLHDPRAAVSACEVTALWLALQQPSLGRDATCLSPHMISCPPTWTQRGSPLLAVLSGTCGLFLSARCTAAPARPWASGPRFDRHPAGKAPHSALPGGPLQLRHKCGLQAGSFIALQCTGHSLLTAAASYAGPGEACREGALSNVLQSTPYQVMLRKRPEHTLPCLEGHSKGSLQALL